MALTTQNSPLIEKTMNLLWNRPEGRTVESIARDAGVTYSWLRSFQYGKIKDASAVRVEAVYNVLSDTPLV